MTDTEARPRTTIEVRNPADGTLAGVVPVETADAVAAKARELRLFQSEWEGIGARGRKKWMLTYRDWMLDNAEHIADVLQSETGKSRVDAAGEPIASADMAKYWAINAEQFLSDEHPRAHSVPMRIKKLTVAYRPYPLVGVITPWNFPFAMLGMDVTPALAAGAAVLLKPSEVTPLSALEFVRGWREVGAPPVLDVATGYGDTGGAVIANVDFVQFTGSTRTGRAIARQCADRLIPYSLELGGKDPALVLADADLDRAANGIVWGGMFNAGQACASVERVYVEAPVYDEFVAKLTEAVRRVRLGHDDRSHKFDIGAMATQTQRDIVARHVDEAVAQGATVRTGGKPTGVGTFFEPTVLTDVTQSMACMSEETFGPTLAPAKVADEDEAIRLANDSRFGLSATVWTRDNERGMQVARQLEVGAVNINDVLSNTFHLTIPMGGWKESGVGARAGGPHGIRKYCRQQAITEPRLPTQASELNWYPTSRRKAKIGQAVLRATAGRGLRRFGITPRKGRDKR